MTITTMTSREFNQDASRAKRAAEAGPVFITDRGRPAHVLLTAADYQALAGKSVSLADALSMPKGPENGFEFDPPRLRLLHRPADFD